MGFQMGLLLADLRDIDWERHWDKNLELIEVTIMGYQEGMVMEKLRDTYWE